MKTKILVFGVVGVVCLLLSGCVGTAKSVLTVNKTIHLDERPLDGLQLGWRLEWAH